METNDNEELTFKKIGLAADLVLAMLRLQARVSEATEETEKQSSAQRDAGHANENNRSGDSRDVDQGLLETRARRGQPEQGV
jgi:hypothetical protein